MITKNLNLKRRSTHCVLSFILQRCRFENSNVVKIEQTYIAQETLYSRQTVSTELKYLQEEGYITYKRALFNNLTTTEITLTEKSIAILNAEASKPQNKIIKTEDTQPQADVPKPQNKPQNKPINTEPRQPQAEVERMRQTAKKQAAEEQTEIPQTPINAHETQEISLQEKFNRLSRVNKIQCKILKDSNFNENYVKLAVEDYKIPFEVIEGIQNNKIVIV